MARSSFKSLAGILHLWLGLASGVVVIVVSLTGCIFVFEEEIRNITQKEFRFVQPEPRPQISASEAVAIITRQFPGKQIDQLRLFSQPDNAIIVKMVEHDKNAAGKHGRKKKYDDEDEENDQAKTVVSLNPYSGKVLGPWDMESDFLHYVEKMHKTLLLGEAGKWIIKFNIVIFLVMLLSGLVLWFPRKRNQVKNAFKMKFDAKWQRINYDFHNVFGFYFVLPLLLVTLTGIWWAVKPSQKLVYAMLGEGKKVEKKMVSKMPLNSKPGDMKFSPAKAFESVASLNPGWNEAHINFSKNNVGAIKINLRYPYQIVRKQNTFEYDPYSGKLLKSEYFRDYTAADQVKHANRSLHTGQAFGFLGKVMMFLASLFAATLPVTGFLIWYQKKNKKPVARKAIVRETSHVALKRKPVMVARTVQKV